MPTKKPLPSTDPSPVPDDIEHVEFGPKSRALLAEIDRRTEATTRRIIREELAAVREVAEEEKNSDEFKLKKQLRGDD